MPKTCAALSSRVAALSICKELQSQTAAGLMNPTHPDATELLDDMIVRDGPADHG